MVEKLQIPESECWKALIQSAKASLHLLSLFEKRDIPLVDNVAGPLKDFVEHYDHDFSPQPTSVKEDDSNINENMAIRNKPYVCDYSGEHDWILVDDNTIQVPLDENNFATCIAVNSAEALEKMAVDIYKASYITIDCEMLTVKKSLPHLKLLQIGVSANKGYAIQVDAVGKAALNKTLKPILEDENINIVGWSYRFDAVAIDHYLGPIAQAPVLDLQAKLKPVAQEQLNLAAAMNMFAGEWEGLTQFQMVKNFFHHFPSTEEHCIWSQTPMPPRALVYAVFDVLSVHALYQYTADHPDSERFYYPFTVISDSSPKALQRFHRQRAQGVSPAPASGTATDTTYPPVRHSKSYTTSYHSKQKHKGTRKEDDDIAPNILIPQPVTDDGYDDNNVEFQKNLQKALENSIKEKHKQAAGASSAGESSSAAAAQEPTASRVIANYQEDYDYRDFAKELSDVKPQISARFAYEESQPVPVKPWGEVGLQDSPFGGTEFDGATSWAHVKTWDDIDDKNYQSNWDNNSSATPVKEAIKVEVNEATPVTKEGLSPKPALASATVTTLKASPRISSPTVTVAASIADSQARSPEVKPQQQPYRPPHQRFSRPMNSHGSASSTTSSYHSAHNNFNSYNKISNRYTNSSPQWQIAGLSSISNLSSASHTPSEVRSPYTPQQQRQQQQQQQQQQPSQQFAAKPSKDKFMQAFQNRTVVGDQTGTYSMTDLETNENPAETWRSFADSTVSNWKQGKDTELDEYEKVESEKKKTVGSTSPSPAVQKFNLTSSPGAWGVSSANEGSGDSSGDNWRKDEERPAFMNFPMKGVPVRTGFTGPRTINPNIVDSSSENEEYSDGSDDVEDLHFPKASSSSKTKNSSSSSNNKKDSKSYGTLTNVNFNQNSNPQSSNSNVAKSNNGGKDKVKNVEHLPTFIDSLFVVDQESGTELNMLKMSAPEHLDMVILPVPGIPYTVAVGFHCVEFKGQAVMKGIQLYISSTGSSYTCVIEQSCHINNMEAIRTSRFGRLLTHPAVRRVCWAPDFFERQMIEKLGFKMGPCVNLQKKINYKGTAYSLSEAMKQHLKDWRDIDQFVEAEEDYQRIALNKKFSGSVWDRSTLPETVLKYSALQGLATFQLYQESKKLALPDESYMYGN